MLPNNERQELLLQYCRYIKDLHFDKARQLMEYHLRTATNASTKVNFRTVWK